MPPVALSTFVPQITSTTTTEPPAPTVTTPPRHTAESDVFVRGNSFIRSVSIAENRLKLTLDEPVLMREVVAFGAFDATFSVPFTPELRAALRGRSVTNVELDEPWRDQKAPLTFKASADGLEIVAPGTSQARGLWEKAPPMFTLTLSDGAALFVETRAKELRFDFGVSTRQGLEKNLGFNKTMIEFHQERLQWGKVRVASPHDETLFDGGPKDALAMVRRAEAEVAAGSRWGAADLKSAQESFARIHSQYMDRARGMIAASQREIDKHRVEVAKLEKTLAGPVSEVRTITIPPQ